jgi:peptidoglycan/xylan/chitin deacetylase (PgdA/CDA1 family)
VRSELSARARRWLAAVFSHSLARARAARLARVSVAAAASIALLSFAVSACGSGGAALGPPGQIRAPLALIGPIVGDAPKATSALYRVVGCRSRGDFDYRHGPSRREVAFGFDDGPYPDTPAFVRMLARNHAPATFFMIGRQVNASYHATMLEALREGDVLGDHTFTHPDLTRSREVRGQLQSTIGAIRSETGYTPCVFRPPYGDYNASVVRTARSLGLATVTWNVDPSDYLQPAPGTIERRVLAQVQPGSIVISHDGGGPRGRTLAAYPAIIRALRARGYRIVTIPQLLGFRPVYVPCIRLCDGIGARRGQLPRDAIIQRAP